MNTFQNSAFGLSAFLGAAVAMAPMESAQASLSFSGFMDEQAVVVGVVDTLPATGILTSAPTAADITYTPTSNGFKNETAVVTLSAAAYPEATGFLVNLANTTFGGASALGASLVIGTTVIDLGNGTTLTDFFVPLGATINLNFVTQVTGGNPLSSGVISLQGLTLTAVPEPSTAISSLLILGLPLVFFRRRRRSQGSVVAG